MSKNQIRFLSKSKVPKMYFLGAPASQKGLKGKNTRLKQLSEQFKRLYSCVQSFEFIRSKKGCQLNIEKHEIL